MSADIQWTEVEIPILGLNERIDKRLLPPGQLVTAKNVEFSTKEGSARKRPGIVKEIDVVSPLSAARGSRLARFNEQLLLADYGPDVSTPPKLFMPNQAADRWYPVGEVPQTVISRTPLAADLGGDVIADVCAVAATGGRNYLVYGIAITQLASSSSTNMGAMIVRVIEQASGSIVLEQVLRSSVEGDTFFAPWVRAAASGDYALLTFAEEDGSHDNTANIKGYVVNLSGNTPSVGSAITVANDQSASAGVSVPHHDTCGLAPSGSTPRWSIAYSSATAPSVVRLKELSSTSLTVIWNVTFGTYPRAISVIRHTSAGTEQVWVNWLDDATIYGNAGPANDWTYAVRKGSDGTSILAPTVWNTTDGVALWTTAISATTSGGKVVVFRSAQLVTNEIVELAWLRASDSGTLDPLLKRENAAIYAKPWRDTITVDRHYIWVASIGKREVITGGSVGGTNYGLLWVPQTQTLDLRGAINETIMMAGSALQERGFNGRGSCPPESSLAFDGTKYHTVHASMYVPGEDTFGPHTVSVALTHLGRGNSVQFGGATYFAGGVPCFWDGVRLREVGYFEPPIILTPTTAGGASSWANAGTLRYAAVFEEVSPSGERTLSGVSDIVTATIVGGSEANTRVTIKVSRNRITRRYWNTLYGMVTPHTVVTIYRTPNPNDTILKRVFTFTDAEIALFISDPDSPGWLTYVDTAQGNMSGANVNKHEALYAGDPTESAGELENDHPYGGCTCLCVHKERLWLGGSDDPELLWYSKTRADDRTAEFSQGQQVRIPGRRVVGLGSLGDNLIAFCQRGIYRILGEGPNAQGNPQSGQFSEPITVSESIGCVGPRSIVSTPIGLFFQAEPGIYLLTPTLSLVWIGANVADIFETYPTVIAAKVVEGTTQVRFVLQGAANIGTMLVYDWTAEKWAEWDHVNVDSWEDAGGWEAHPFGYLSAGGRLFTETADTWEDDTTDYFEEIEFGWLSLGRVQGYKRIHRIGLLLEQLGEHGFEVAIKRGYDENAAWETFTWSSDDVFTAGIAEWFRITLASKTPAIKIRVKETLSSASPPLKGFALQSLALELGMIPGIRRLPALQSK